MKTAEIFIPKKTPNDTDLFVSVNGKHYSLMKGILIKVPLSVKEVVEASFRQEAEAERFIKSNMSF